MLNQNEKPQDEISKIEQALIFRDEQDEIIDKQNRQELESSGLKEYEVKKRIEINSGEIEGVENVVAKILEEIESNHKIISIDGQSGTGKSSTARILAQELDGVLFSMGEIFRYLTFLKFIRNTSDVKAVFQNLRYEVYDNQVHLFDEQNNISIEMKDDLRDRELEAKIPQVAKETQSEVIRFVAAQIKNMTSDLDKQIIMEGRAFTLDYLPTDIRISLVADPKIRAKRR